MTKNVAELFFPSNIIYFGAEIKTWEKVKFTDPLPDLVCETVKLRK